MYLKELSLLNFKNCRETSLQLSPKINCMTGPNGAGKTNLLDSVYYLSFCKSFFNPIDSQNIMHGESFFVIQGSYELQGKNEDIYCGIKRGQKKQFKRNKKDYPKLSEHIGLLPLVMISPSDINLIVAGSEERRKYMDSVISQYDKDYLEKLIDYNRALSQRNALLKQMERRRQFDRESLAVWDARLAGNGDIIYNKRVDFIERLVPIFQRYYTDISGGQEQVGLSYRSQLHESTMQQELQACLEKDRVLLYTTAGIHKDDLELELSGHPMKKTGSQGQKKTYLVSLKLAQFDFMKELNGFKPILLLDDVFDKLDGQRVEQIIRLMADQHFGQVFITDTDVERLRGILARIGTDHRIFPIRGGAILENSENKEKT